MRVPGPQPRFSLTREESRLERGSIIEYEQDGRPILGVLIEERKGKWQLINQRGREVDLPATRLYLLPGKFPSQGANPQSYLEELEGKALTLLAQINLEEVWETVRENTREITIKEVTELCFGDDSGATRLATKRALLGDKVYFKRKKITYEPREEEIVNELRKQLAAEAKREEVRKVLITAVVNRLNNTESTLPSTISLLEELAVFGTEAKNLKEAQHLVEQIISLSGRTLHGDWGDKAFELLVLIKHFSRDENLVVRRYQRSRDFPSTVLKEAEALRHNTLALSPLREDFRSLTTIAIDSASTKDVDDALSLETTPSGFRLGIHIADVSAQIPLESEIYREALARGTSIYCPDLHIPMIPRALSEDTLSLHQDQDRLTMSCFVELDSAFQVTSRAFRLGRISVTKRLSYDEVDHVLQGETSEHPFSKMLTSLLTIADALLAIRLSHGAFQFQRRQRSPLLKPDGTITLEDQNELTPAHRLVGEFMILANEAAGWLGREHGLPLIYRSQEAPDVNLEEQGLDISDGIAREYFQRSFLKRSLLSAQPLAHFGLGIEAYAQVTSPIRRAIDLINQRQIQEFLTRGNALFTETQVSEFIQGLDQPLQDAHNIQRECDRYWLLRYLQQTGLREIEGTVMKTDLSKPLAELDGLFSLNVFFPPGFRNDRRIRTTKKPGDRVKLRIDNIDPRRDTLSLTEIG